MLKKIISFIMVVGIVTILPACSNKNTNEISKSQSKIQVIVSFNAIREFAEAVGQDKIEVKTIVPEGIEPHDFELKARDLGDLNNAKVFVYNGLGMEKWAEKTLQSLDNKDLVAVEASKGIEPIINNEDGEIEEHGKYDPHLWISLKGAEIQAKNIKDALIKVDSVNKDFYEQNYKNFYDKLEQLYNDYTAKFSSVSNKNFVTGHAAFAYLCKDFGLTQNSVEDVFAEGEPSANRLKELVDYCKTNKIKTIFVEDMVSPKISETLAKEVGAKTEKIYTIESKEDGKDYIQSMKDNLEKIYASMK